MKIKNDKERTKNENTGKLFLMTEAIGKKLIQYCRQADKVCCPIHKRCFIVSLDNKNPYRMLRKKGEKLAVVKWEIVLSRYPKIPGIDKKTIKRVRYGYRMYMNSYDRSWNGKNNTPK